MSYATGYKLSFSGKVIQKTGMLILDTEPERARIYIDGKPQQLLFKKYYNKEESYIETPAKIKNLIPGEYNVKIVLDGYWEWQKKLIIEPGMSTFAEDITLFKKNLALNTINTWFSDAIQSKEKNYLALNEEKHISIFNIETDQITLKIAKDINKGLNIDDSLLWSDDGKKIIFNSQIYDLENLSEKQLLDNLISLNIKKAELYNNKLFYITKNQKNIKSYGLDSEVNETIINNENISDFFIKENNLYFINNINKATNLIIYNIDSKQTTRNIELPTMSEYKFVNPNHRYINLYNKKHQILYIIDHKSYYPLKEIINNIKYTYWVKENKLLYANDFEIWIADFNSVGSARKTILTRISDVIYNILWHPNNNYVIYSTGNAIYAIELDDREKHNIIELIKFDAISSVFLNNNADTLYFYGKIGNQEGLYKLAIQ